MLEGSTICIRVTFGLRYRFLNYRVTAMAPKDEYIDDDDLRRCKLVI